MIYATPFRASDKQPAGCSQPSGFDSIAEVVDAMGPPDIYYSGRMAIYGPGEDRVIFSAVVFQIDEPGTSG
jgi:hypothetical protein